MKPSFLKTTIIGVIAFLAIGFLLRSHYSAKTARTNLAVLKSEVDSLRLLTANYTRLQAQYDSLHSSMEDTREKMVDLKSKISELSGNQIVSLKTIKSELHSIASDLDSISFVTVKASDLDSLKF